MFRFLLALFAIQFLCSNHVVAQVDSLLHLAYRNEDDANYEVALEYYEKALAASKDKWNKSLVHYQTADYFVKICDYAAAAKQYQLAYKKDPSDKEVLYHWARFLWQANQPEEAAKVAKKYIKQGYYTELGEALMEGITLSEKWRAEPLPIMVEVDEQLSTESMDFAPVFVDSSKKVLMFSTNRHVVKGEKNAGTKTAVFYSSKQDNGWSESIRLDTNVNKSGAEGVVSFDHQRGVIFFTRCGYRHCGIHYAFLEGELAGESFPLVFENNVQNSSTLGHPSYSSELELLFFASDMPGGFGGRDIWYATYNKETDTWGSPINAGSRINTAGDEMFPSIQPNGMLYFSSNGHAGMGGLDLFNCKFERGGNWQSPENLKYPFNSSGDDFGIIFQNEESGYLTSNRAGGLGSDDIYRFTPIAPSLSDSDKQETSKAEIETALNGVSKLVNNGICEEMVKQPAINQLKLYPNPNNGEFSLNLVATAQIDVLVRVYSSVGILAYEKRMQLQNGTNTLPFNLVGLKSGVYHVQFVSGCETIGFQKFILN